MDNFREWLSDNLRYILLGLAGILILVIAFFAVRLVTSLGSTKKKEPATEASTEVSTEQITEAPAAERLVKDQADILSFVTEYYTAVVDGDFDKIASISDHFDDTIRANLEAENSAIESCSNFITYSRKGLTDGSYVVYAYFDAKLTGIDTAAPTLRQLYLETDEQGSLKIIDISENKEIEDYTTDLLADDEIQALRDDVKKKLDDACNSDEQLKNFVASVSTGTSDSGVDDGADDGTDSGAAVPTGTMQVSTDSLNVRGTPSTDGTLYGILTSGTQVEVLENTNDGWSKVRYTVNGTTIEGYVKSEYLSSVQ